MVLFVIKGAGFRLGLHMKVQPTDQEIAYYLKCIDDSKALGRATRRRKLLEHLIRAEAKGDGASLKAYSIGLDVMDKSADFDPSLDSGVRVEIGRLRAALKEFEASDPPDDAIVVNIPVGTYRPEFFRRKSEPVIEPGGSDEAPGRSTFRISRVLSSMAAVLIISFASLLWLRSPSSGVEAVRGITIRIEDFDRASALELAVGALLREKLAKGSSITVYAPGPENASATKTDYVFRGRYSDLDAARIKVGGELLDTSDGGVIWAKTVTAKVSESVEDDLATFFGEELRVRLYGQSKAILEGGDLGKLSPEQLFIMATWVPGPAENAVNWEKQRIEYVELALRNAPSFGAAHSVLADKLAYLANVYGPANSPEALEKARWHAQRAVELAPLNADAMFNVAQSQWHSGMVDASRASMRRVLELDDSHSLARFLEIVIPYTCAVAGDDVLERAIGFDARLSTDNPIRWLTLTWIAWLHAHRNEYELALERERQASLIFEIPYTFMRHAMLLNKMGRPDDAAKIILRQRTNWPSIDPEHFAAVTIPRLCREQDEPGAFVKRYEDLAAAMRGRL